MLRHRPVVGGAQAPGLVHRRVRIGIVPGRQGADEHFGCRVLDGFLEVLHALFFRLQQPERPREDAMLEGGIVGNAEWPSQREVTEEAARRCHPVELFPNGANRDGGDPGGLEHVRERTDRTRAEGSDRGQDDDVDAMLLQERGAGRAAVHANAG